jgi:hypothetical protein
MGNKVVNLCSKREVGWGLAIVVGLLLSGCGLVAERPSALLPEDTGIPVGEQFADFYYEMGGAFLFGYPITEPFQPTETEPLVQYFQAMRLEYDGQQVQITPLGVWAFAGIGSGVETYAAPPTARNRVFEEAGQAMMVWDEFLVFYEAHQGEMLLGLPLSSQLNEAGVRVQYFENGRLEWRPELPIGQRVQLSPLSQAHFQAEMTMIYRDGIRNAGPVPAADLNRANISASVRAPILYAGDEQVLYVTVLRPDGRAVSDVQATVVISYDGEQLVYDLGQPDTEGKIRAHLPIAGVPPGKQVLLDIRVYAPGGREIGRETLGFRTWW